MLTKIKLFSGVLVLSLSAFVPLILVTTSVQAQAVEEIVVTARKREESLQEVPISISAFSSRQMQERGIRNNFDVARFTPNFSTAQRVGRDLDRPIIRGMVNPGSRGEPNASYFIDGTFVARTISTATTASMERVEVLRGPQSAQFGRATFSGAVNYVTRKPTNEFEGQLNLNAGTSDYREISGWVSGPIVEDKLLFLASAAYDEYGGQWNNNLQPDSAFVNGVQGTSFTTLFGSQSLEGDTSPLGEEETTDLLLKLTWLPFESTEVNLKYGYTEGDDGQYPTNVFDTLNCQLPDNDAIDSNTGEFVEPWYPTSAGAFCGEYKIDGTENRKNLPDLRNGLFVENTIIDADDLPPNQLTSAPVKPGLRRETNRFLGEWIQDIAEWTSSLKLSYSEDDFDSAYDLDHQQVRAVWGLFAFNNVFYTEDKSFEYAIETPSDWRVRGKLGVYYYEQDLTDEQRSVTGPLAAFDTAPGTDFQDPRLQEIDNKSVFGSIGVDLADHWALSVEARYAEDDKDIRSGQRNMMNESAPVTDSLSFSSFTPRITLESRPTDDLMYYFQIANGTKPGGFNTEYYRSDIFSEFTETLINCDPANPAPLSDCSEQEFLTYKEEEQWTYEVGIKTTWWDQRILANLSVFYIDWENQGLFLTKILPNSSGTTNTTTILVNAGRSEIYGLEWESNFAVTDNLSLVANYGYNHGEFKEGFDPGYAALTGGDGNLSGNKLPDSPNHSVILGFDARAQVSSSLEGFVRGDFLYESKKYTSAANFGTIGERKNVNFRTGVQADSWTLTFFVRNLTDDDTPISLFSFVDFAAQEKNYDFVDLELPLDGTIDTFDGAPNNTVYPNMSALNPQRGRDWGMEFQYRF